MDFTKQRSFWMVGPQSIGVLFVFLILAGGVWAGGLVGVMTAGDYWHHQQVAGTSAADTAAKPASAASAPVTVTQQDAATSAADVPSDPPAASFPPDPDDTQYKTVACTGPMTLPDLTNRKSDYWDFRIRIKDAATAGPNFAGDAAIAEFGCGTDCVAGFVINLQTGRVAELPVGGEDFYALSLRYDVSSRLLRAQWQNQPDATTTTCYRQYFVWTGTAFASADKRSAPGTCPE